MMKLFLALALVVALFQACASQQCLQDPVNNTSWGWPGAPQYITIDNNVKAVALNASVQWNQLYSSSADFFKVTCIRNAQSQIVAGMLYTVNATIAETSCAKSQIMSQNQLSQSNVDNCQLLANGKSYNCVFYYLQQPWLNLYVLAAKPNCQ